MLNYSKLVPSQIIYFCKNNDEENVYIHEPEKTTIQIFYKDEKNNEECF